MVTLLGFVLAVVADSFAHSHEEELFSKADLAWPGKARPEGCDT